MEAITITKPQLQAAMLQWEQDHRGGKTMSLDEAAAMTAEQVAEQSTDALWTALQAKG